MIRRRRPVPDVGALGPHAIRLRNSCLGALSRRRSLRPPTPVELSKIRDDLGLREAWEWWVQLDMPMEIVRPISRRSARSRRPDWKRVAIAVLTSGAWLIVPYATAMALVAMV